MRNFAKAAILTGFLAVPTAVLHAEELTYGHYISPTAGTYVDALEPFFDRVAEATNGEVTFKAFLSGTMGGPKDLVNAVETNVVDSAAFIDVYIPATLPYSTTLSALSEAVTNPLAFNAAANEFQLLHCPGCQADYENSNGVALAFTTTATYHLMCAQKASTLSEISGKKVRGAGQTMVRLLEKMGATPVSISSKEIYEAMQRGQVDCTAGPTSWLKSYNLGEFVKSIVKTPMGAYGNSGLFMMNADVWHDLSPEQRRAILDQMGQLVADANFSQLEEAETALDAAVANGAVVYEGGDDLNALVLATQQDAPENARLDGEARGVKDADRLLTDFEGIIAKWEGIIAEIGTDDKAAYADALNREIYAKIAN